jgi:hypothetical protein
MNGCSKIGVDGMATATKTRGARKRLTCPECGFKAAHPMGLGRHRSAKHGAVSQRELRRRTGATDGVSAAAFDRLKDRITELERRYEALIRELSSVGRGARRRGR